MSSVGLGWHDGSVPAPAALPRPPRSLGARLLSLVARPLAEDDHRAEFWVRHLRLGVALNELTSAMVAVYVIGADRPHRWITTGIAVIAVIAAPLLLLVPVRRWSRDLRGCAFFYAWSIATTVLVSTAAVLDGGGDSPLLWLYVLPLTYAGLAYPPVGVMGMGALMVVAHTTCAVISGTPTGATLMQISVLVAMSLMVMSISRNQWELSSEQHELTRLLAHHADTDALTSCLSRRGFSEQLESAARSIAPRAPVSLCMIDLDGFKSVNDSAGHAAGDELLRLIADALRSDLRDSDRVGRLGGDEFAVLLPRTETGVAAEVAERLRLGIERVGRDHAVTASIGVVTARTPAEGLRLIVVADAQMYDAKRAGGNRLLAAG